MKGNMVVFVVVAVVGMTGTDSGRTAQGQVVGAAGNDALPPPESPILRESFDDGQTAACWRLYAEDPNNCWVAQADQHLELRGKQGATGTFAGYVTQTWRLDPRHDFTLHVDLHYSPRTEAGGWIGLGLTTSSERPRAHYVEVGIGCANGYAHYRYETRDGLSLRSGFTERHRDDVTLYFSYDAAEDTLYVGEAGYGPAGAWTTFSDLIQGAWGGAPLFLMLGGSADRLALGPGQAFTDNLVVETGTVIEAALHEVYRLWAPVTERHFYTISPEEKDILLTYYPDVWTFESVAFRAFRDDSDPACRPVHRFWSPFLNSHFYTIKEREKDKILTQYASIWTYEGVAFYAYPEGQQPASAKPVYRFWSDRKGTHFYAIDEEEKNRVLTQYGDAWTYEGVAWYALP